MKNIFYILALSILFSSTLLAQNMVDTNTDLIANYFVQQQHSDLTRFTNENLQTEESSNVVINQIGNYNNAFVLANQENTQILTQQGDSNNFEYYTFYNSIESTITTIQNGNSNDIQIFGQNSISKNMTINQHANNQTIWVFNY
jgi:hypothetical protein